MLLDEIKGFIDGTCTSGESGSCFLREEDDQAIIKRIELVKLPRNSLVIPLDSLRKKKCKGECKRKTIRVLSFLNDEARTKAHRITDYLLLHDTGNGNIEAFYIDLKSDNPAGVETQFNGSVCALKYLAAFLELQHGRPVKIVKEVYVVICSKDVAGINLRKQKIAKREGRVSSARDPFLISRQDRGKVYFKELNGEIE